MSLADEAKLAGTSWRVEDIGGHEVDPEVQSILDFGVDGRVSGSGGCNRLTGAFTVEGQELHFGPIATTRRMCPRQVMDQEQRFLQNLDAARRFELQTGKLLLYGDGNHAVPLLRLAPAKPAPPDGE